MKNFKNYFDKIYCISYIEDTIRHENIVKQLKKYKLENGVEYSYGMPYSKITAIKPLFEYLAKFMTDGAGRVNGIGCALNHYTVIKTAYQLGYESILVFEDDILIRDNRDLIIEYLDNLPEDWDYIYFAPCFHPRSINNEDILLFNNYLVNTINGNNIKNNYWVNLKDCKNGKYLRNPKENSNTSFVSSSCYAMKRAAMKLYIDIFESKPIIDHSDNMEFFSHNFSESPLNSYTPNCTLFTITSELDTLLYNQNTKQLNINSSKWSIANCIDCTSNNFKYPLKENISLIYPEP